MDGQEYQENLKLIASQARIISMVDIPDLLSRIERADSMGAILDPTLYRAKHEAMMQDKAMLKAALPLYRWFKEMEAKIKTG